MGDSKELTVVDGGAMTLQDKRDVLSYEKDLANVYKQSGALPSEYNIPQIMMMLQSGRAIGLSPTESINSFYFIKGRITLFGKAAISQVLKAGHTINWGECTAATATVEIIRGDGQGRKKTTYTMAMAKDRGLTKGRSGEKDVWRKFPDNMLMFKVFHLTASFICPDALAGSYIKEDFEGSNGIAGLENDESREDNAPATSRKAPKSMVVEPVPETGPDETPKAEPVEATEITEHDILADEINEYAASLGVSNKEVKMLMDEAKIKSRKELTKAKAKKVKASIKAFSDAAGSDEEKSETGETDEET